MSLPAKLRLAILFTACSFVLSAGARNVSNCKDVSFSLISEKDGSLWIATASRGIIRQGLTGRVFQYSAEKGDFPCDSIASLALDHSGELWMRDARGNMFRYSSLEGFVPVASGSDGVPVSLMGLSGSEEKDLSLSAPVSVPTEPQEKRAGFLFWLLCIVAAFGLGFALSRRSSKTFVASAVPASSLVSKVRKAHPAVHLPESQGVPVSPNGSEFYNKVLDIVRSSYTDPDFSVESIAAKLGITRVHLCRKLKAESCPSPSEIIKTERMHAAVSLLRAGESNMAEISQKCGFTSPAYFSVAFKAWSGVSPSDFVAKSNL